MEKKKKRLELELGGELVQDIWICKKVAHSEWLGKFHGWIKLANMHMPFTIKHLSNSRATQEKA